MLGVLTELVPRSSCQIVVAQQAAQAVATTNPAAIGRGRSRRNQIVAEALVIPLLVVVHHELFEHVQETSLAQEDQAVQALLPNRAAKSGPIVDFPAP